MRDVVAIAARDGNERGGIHADARKERAVFGLDALEVRAVVADEVHLVHQDREVPNAQHRHHVAVPARVLLDAFVGVDDQERGFGAGRAGDHVLQELDVAGRVDDDVVASARLEEHARGVDRDALRAFVLQRVEQEGVFERLRRARAQRLDLLELSFGQRVRVGKQAADDGALPVIDVAANDDIHPAAVDLGGGLRLCHRGRPPFSYPAAWRRIVPCRAAADSARDRLNASLPTREGTAELRCPQPRARDDSSGNCPGCEGTPHPPPSSFP